MNWTDVWLSCPQVNYGDCYYFKPMSLDDLQGVDAHLACAFNNINFRNPAEYTVVLTGEGGDGGAE